MAIAVKTAISSAAEGTMVPTAPHHTNVEKNATLIHALVIIYAIVVTMVGEEIIAKLSVQVATVARIA